MKKRYISKSKAVSNIKNKWWILASLFWVAVFVGMLSVSNNAVEEESSTRESVVDATEKYYQAQVVVCVPDNVNITNYQFLCNSASVMDRLDQELYNDNFDKIGADDILTAYTQSDNILLVFVTSNTDSNRVRVMAEKLADIIMNAGDELYGIQTERTYQYSNAYAVEKGKDGTYTRVYENIETTTELNEDIETTTELNEDIEKTSDFKEKRFSLKNLFSAKGAVIVLSGLVIGAFIIYILIILDSHIYVADDVIALYDGKLPYMGALNSKEIEATNAVIMARAVKDGLNKLAITESSDYSDKRKQDNYANKVCELNEKGKIAYLDNLETNIESIERLNEHDGVIICVHSIFDSEKSISDVVSKINVVGANLIGFVMD